MRGVQVLFLLGILAAGSLQAETPRLVVVISVDQLRPDYLQRFSSDFLPARRGDQTGGFKLLLQEGAVYLNAAFSHFPTFTCPGHSAILTGAFPSVSGIIGNRWFDRESGRVVSCVDPLGNSGDPERSPRNLLVSTVGDELKLATNRSGRVIGLGGKDYAVMALVGRMADVALWFDRSRGQWASSTHYTRMHALPQWVSHLNSSGPAERFRSRVWVPLLGTQAYRYANSEPALEGQRESPYGFGWRFPHRLSEEDDRGEFYYRLMASPFGNEVILDAAREAIRNESLGADSTPDILALALSPHDYVGHAFGPSSPEVIDSVLRIDRQLSSFFTFLSRQVGEEHVLVVLTSDHGVQYIPREIHARGGAAGRVPGAGIKAAVESVLDARFGSGNWVQAVVDLDLYLNQQLVRDKGLQADEVDVVAAEAVSQVAGVHQAFARSRIVGGQVPATDLGRRVSNSFHPTRSGDVVIAYESNWFFDEDLTTTHGTHYAANTRVPILIWGGAVPAGKHWRAVDPRDIAPTLSLMLGVGVPSGCSGQPLMEVLESSRP